MSNNNFEWGWVMYPVVYFLGKFVGQSQADELNKQAQRDAELQRLREEVNRLKARP